jgi:hypothetical protein
MYTFFSMRSCIMRVYRPAIRARENGISRKIGVLGWNLGDVLMLMRVHEASGRDPTSMFDVSKAF